MPKLDDYKFYSGYISSAQRLPNGNTLITEGADGRIFEVTRRYEIVWEFVSPDLYGKKHNINRIYRAYRVPYEWVPQLETPEESAVNPPPLSEFRIRSDAEKEEEDDDEGEGMKAY